VVLTLPRQESLPAAEHATQFTNPAASEAGQT
jgi:hypothetical protein